MKLILFRIINRRVNTILTHGHRDLAVSVYQGNK